MMMKQEIAREITKSRNQTANTGFTLGDRVAVGDKFSACTGAGFSTRSISYYLIQIPASLPAVASDTYQSSWNA